MLHSGYLASLSFIDFPSDIRHLLFKNILCRYQKFQVLQVNPCKLSLAFPTQAYLAAPTCQRLTHHIPPSHSIPSSSESMTIAQTLRGKALQSYSSVLPPTALICIPPSCHSHITPAAPFIFPCSPGIPWHRLYRHPMYTMHIHTAIKCFIHTFNMTV